MYVGELLVQWFKGLVCSYYLLFLCGFVVFVDVESLICYCYDFGEVMLWLFGVVFELVEQEGVEDYIFVNNYVLLYWDGMYLEMVLEFQVFYCVDVFGDSDGGCIIFSLILVVL